jgi:hypothetical protein
MQVYRVNTTAYEEEDFFLLTDLTEEQIKNVVTPIVTAERDGYQEYDNEMITDALQKRYPGKLVVSYTEFETITI